MRIIIGLVVNPLNNRVSIAKGIVSILLLLFQITSSQAAVTWFWWSTPTDVNASNAIASAMNQAVATYNTYSDYTYNIGVQHNPGVPTAQAGYHGLIEFGGQIGFRTAMHEMAHWFGTGSQGAWNNYRQGSQWLGTYANNAVQAYDGPYATVGCDAQHYWPYGWNYDNEGVNPERLVGLVGAFMRDMGIDEDRTIGFAPGTYRLRNRGSVKMLDNGGSAIDGTQVSQSGETGSVNQQWVLSLVSGTKYFTLRSVGNGKFLDSLGNSADGAAIGLAAENFGTSQQWQVLKTDSGFYQIVNRATGKCLSTVGRTTDGTGLVNATPGSGLEQQWKFVHPTLVTIPAGLISQYRPTTASSSVGGHLPCNATDGESALIRWTADGGGYPQWWRVDLGSSYSITNIITYWYPGWSFKYRIETSADDINYTTAVDATGSTIVGYTTNSLSATARFVRITATGITPSGGWASFYDCQVFGTPVIPSAPTSLVATPTSSRAVNLNWADQGGVSSYNVKRSTTSGGPYATAATGVKGISYSDSGLSASTTYYYVVSAVNGAGESSNSAQAAATTPAAVVPSAVTGLTASPGHNLVTLYWNPSSEAANYNVKRATSSGGPYSPIGTAAAASYTDTTAVNGTAYYYTVSAVNMAGESANSAQVAATPTAVFGHWKFDATSGSTASDSAGSNTGSLVGNVTWTAGKIGNAISLDGSGGYVNLPVGLISAQNDFSITAWVYVNDNRTWARAFDFGSGTSVYMFLAPASGGNTMRYAITTSGSGGEQQINGPVLSPGVWHHVAVTLSGTTGTLYVDGVAVGSNTAMTLKPSNLGSTTQNYIGKSQWPDPAFNGRVDDFRIYSRALSSAEVAAAFNPQSLPPMPTGLAATAGNNQVGLTWNASSGATSYNVKRATTSGGPYSTIASPTANSYTDTTAVNATTYYYVVSAVNSSGESGNSSQVTAMPTAPSLPSPWVTADIGTVGAAGSAGSSGGTFTVIGSGADIWDVADEFRYVYQTSSGTCEMRARVATIQNTDPWAKSGVMIRESAAAGARYAAVFITPGNGVTFQRRTTTGGATVNTVVTAVTAPRYVRIQRAASNSFRAYYSSNGSTWTQIGANQTITMATSATMGLAVTSHNDGTLCTSTLDNVTATP